MSGHTPGLWEYEGGPSHGGAVFSESTRLALIEARPECVANGRLMAAAPNLLDALRKFGQHGRYCGFVGDGIREPAEMIDRCTCGLDAAIEKATGEAQS